MAGYFTGSKCSCPSKSNILFIILTLTAAGIHGVSQLSYMTSYTKSCELHTEDVKCHIHQGLWYYCETALSNSTTSCSYDHLKDWVRGAAILSAVGMATLVFVWMMVVVTSCGLMGLKLKPLKFALTVVSEVLILSVLTIYGLKSQSKEFGFCFICEILTVVIINVTVTIYIVLWIKERQKEPTEMKPLIASG
ncbi:unnamed protein product [Mytilus edulis]|uniref:Uncharacterized protein n=1 Tax=Mytilus edulis TaxID=6550 RepID=A0A8S3QCM8_MYTED|nr:unnamed protein product [Mytilus edulis]